MVETNTRNAYADAVRRLAAHGCLDARLAEELTALEGKLDDVSPWLRWDEFAARHDIQLVRGMGPATKVLRVLTFALQAAAAHVGAWPDHLVLTAFEIPQAVAGCSDFRGSVVLRAKHGEQDAEVIAGPFVWDCAAWGVDQTEAAQQRGFDCMVEFPPLQLAAAAS